MRTMRSKVELQIYYKQLEEPFVQETSYKLLKEAFSENDDDCAVVVWA
ncbi:unnamed protein product [Acanthoscelides obtectus]|uniref:Uncharacterized protein n=1 Tax=Acanthoscelides obtectus TaxID=200917 RepID=A0A9P0LQ70_ACAOB|nr:unnamed protein product [Acanthoscelides obtectus]CAK1676606.1 hypothetical protein AOBTE_LOCUS30848 [Acanthoscelides obtectus]